MNSIIYQIATIWRLVTKSFTRIALVFAFVFGPHLSQACTAFAFQDGAGNRLVAKNFDWSSGAGELIYSPRGFDRKSIESNSLSWTSKYKSIKFLPTFSDEEKRKIFPEGSNDTLEVRSQSPMGGINEKGLTIEVVWFKGAYPAKDLTRKSLNQLELVSYLLDTADNVADIKKEIEDKFFDPNNATNAQSNEEKWTIINRFQQPIHYFVCDPSDCIILEFQNGNLLVFDQKSQLANEENLNFSILTNSPYEDSRLSAKSPENYPNPGSKATGLGRFIIVRDLLKNKPSATVNQAFQILRIASVDPKVSKAAQTQWSSVYNPKTLQVFIKDQGGAGIRKFAEGTNVEDEMAFPIKSQIFDLTHEDGDVPRELLQLQGRAQ